MNKYTVTINNKNHIVNADEKMPMLWVLRDLLDKKGTKFGCGKGLCGACTINMDGKAVRSCQLPISAVGNARITTIEGLEKDNRLVKAWVKHKVPQCGFCQPGQIMQANAFLNSNKAKTLSNIKESMSGNICRCGCYPRISTAILEAAKEA